MSTAFWEVGSGPHDTGVVDISVQPALWPLISIDRLYRASSHLQLRSIPETHILRLNNVISTSMFQCIPTSLMCVWHHAVTLCKYKISDDQQESYSHIHSATTVSVFNWEYEVHRKRHVSANQNGNVVAHLLGAPMGTHPKAPESNNTHVLLTEPHTMWPNEWTMWNPAVASPDTSCTVS